MHEHALRLVYKDKIYSFWELLERDKSATVHERNIQVQININIQSKKWGCTWNNDKNFKIQRPFI